MFLYIFSLKKKKKKYNLYTFLNMACDLFFFCNFFTFYEYEK